MPDVPVAAEHVPIRLRGWSIQIFGEIDTAARKTLDELDLPVHVFSVSNDARVERLGVRCSVSASPEPACRCCCVMGNIESIQPYVIE